MAGRRSAMLSFGATAPSNPWAELVRVQREMDRFFNRFESTTRAHVFPPINIYESEGEFLLVAELPGIDPATLDVTVVRNELILKGERKAPTLPEGSAVHRRERTFGSFSRSFTLPDSVDGENVKATWKDGLLEVVVPKLPAARPRQITIRAE